MGWAPAPPGLTSGSDSSTDSSDLEKEIELLRGALAKAEKQLEEEKAAQADRQRQAGEVKAALLEAREERGEAASREHVGLMGEQGTESYTRRVLVWILLVIVS